jgi:hypothetical protein
MKKYLFPVVALVATMASCTSDVEDAAVSEQTGKAQKYVISAKPFENADDITRTILTDGTSGITFEWGFNEKFGVIQLHLMQTTKQNGISFRTVLTMTIGQSSTKIQIVPSSVDKDGNYRTMLPTSHTSHT